MAKYAGESNIKYHFKDKIEHILGLMYAEGIGTKENPQQALYWYTKAANHGNHEAQCNLGRCHEKGTGTPSNMDIALYWYTKSANGNCPQGQYILASCYFNGIGTKQNLSEAHKLILKAKNSLNLPDDDLLYYSIINTVSNSHITETLNT